MREEGGRRGGGGGAADAGLKTKTPHVNVGKNTYRNLARFHMHLLKYSPENRLSVAICPPLPKAVPLSKNTYQETTASVASLRQSACL